MSPEHLHHVSWEKMKRLALGALTHRSGALPVEKSAPQPSMRALTCLLCLRTAISGRSDSQPPPCVPPPRPQQAGAVGRSCLDAFRCAEGG